MMHIRLVPKLLLMWRVIQKHIWEIACNKKIFAWNRPSENAAELEVFGHSPGIWLTVQRIWGNS